MNENPRCCGMDICNIELNTGYERVEGKWIVVEGEGELRAHISYLLGGSPLYVEG